MARSLSSVQSVSSESSTTDSAEGGLKHGVLDIVGSCSFAVSSVGVCELVVSVDETGVAATE